MTGSAAAAWAAIVLTILAYLGRDLIRRGKIDNVLEQLSQITADHEDRIRGLEANERRPPQHRQGGRHVNR